ncbi:family 2A encapsulin nanocompartment cargo protein cysteine desulfurase [Robbsia andropogonis]|uniref:family 2A encapsulin nanocompartment cargo protein cysteine desulfurase n=1 Tax=Robbsia andropogonis TaxID=28092 RepID=UPI0020A21A9E|nr:family 2A encapsulin nanocompartment cargo protein cysteine desulfurase [Robbsia andropogonis]MCP1119100.1 SufS family cysteine desulfurase [Robbsia andropogonis]MCP1129049.1 SufS family cysteine desulfurase [Robbsia andropogonis]
MTTPTPTADIANPGAQAPAGLPDPGTLARLATAFFTALPGQSPASSLVPGSGAPGGVTIVLPQAVTALNVAANPAPGGSPFAGPGGTGTGASSSGVPVGALPGTNLLSSAPTQVLTLGNRAPSLAPHASAGNDIPDTVVTTAPTIEPRTGGTALGGTPGITSSLFYFIDSASHGWRAQPAAVVPPARATVAPEAFGLPDANSLRDLLSSNHRHASQSGSEAPPRYFLDEPDAPDYSRRPITSDRFDGERRFTSTHATFDVDAVRRDFPILRERVNGKPLVWLDNAATTHKPQAVIDRLAYFYSHENSNIHRAAHALAGRATDAYEHARDTVRRFIGAASSDEIIFVRGTTEGINLVAKTWGEQNVEAGDDIIVSHLEHHANIVPWQQLASRKGATLKVIPVDDSGQVKLDAFRQLLTHRTKIVSVTQVSNALGTVVPVKEIVALAHSVGAVALVDGAQSISHMRVNVQAIDADFFVFSGHKIYGPTGIGAVYGKRHLLDAMPPWQGGGNMIADVTFERTVFQAPPSRFEAGTGNIADAVGLGAALEYVDRIGIERIARYEHDLLAYATERLGRVPGVRLVGTANEKASVLSFVLKGYETEEVGRALNDEGVAVRSGHHCAQPILRRFGLEATVRPSLAFYNTRDEVDLLTSVVRRLSGRR